MRCYNVNACGEVTVILSVGTSVTNAGLISILRHIPRNHGASVTVVLYA